MVSVTCVGHQWRVHLECSLCRIAKIEQYHLRTKPIEAVESAIKTTARTLGWHVISQAAVCGACGRQQ